AVIPSTGVSNFPEALLPQLSFVAAADQRKSSTGNDGNIGAPENLEEAECMGDLFIAPLIAADHRRPTNFDLGRLNHHQQGLHVAAAGGGKVFIDDDLAAGLGQSRGCDKKKQTTESTEVQGGGIRILTLCFSVCSVVHKQFVAHD